MSRSRFYKYLLVQALTLGRVPLILLFLAVTIAVDTRSSYWGFSVAIVAIILSALTDTFDGYFARKFEVTSKLGAYADPLTDKIFYLTTFPTLVFLACNQRVCENAIGDLGQAFHSKLLLILAILFLMRDQWTSFLRSIGALHNLSAKANWSGKLRTIVSFPVICTVYWYLQAPEDYLYGILPFHRWPFFIYALEILSLVINIISIGVYTRYYWPALKKEIPFPNKEERNLS
ncbi:MAG: CDP-alcohol phosphatidyltransferase family protein [Planctomycetes bacterium]|nr:CDP-alcohol phosphatidyltransferase family protein [Planctomycetota bacterium]